MYWSAAPPSTPVRFGEVITRYPFHLSAVPSPSPVQGGDTATAGHMARIRTYVPRRTDPSLDVPSVTVTAKVPGKPLDYLRTCSFRKYGCVRVLSVHRPWQASSLTLDAYASEHANPLDFGRLTSRQLPTRTTGSSVASNTVYASLGTSTDSSLPTQKSAEPNRTISGWLRSTRGKLNETSRGRT